MRLARWVYIVVAFIWFAAALFAVNWVGTNKFTEFDPKLQLSEAIMSLSFEDEFTELLPLSEINRANIGQIYHVFQGDCFCERLSESHRNSLNLWAQSNDVGYQQLNIREHPNLQQFIPSTPAVIVTNQQGDLVYFGPYSSGFGCFENSGLVDEKIDAYFAQENPSEKAYIQSEAEGCYCEVSKPLRWPD